MIITQDKANVRAQSFILFGNLSEFGDGPSKQPFLEQIHSNFVSLLLHLNDPDVEVKKVNILKFIFMRYV
jgi:dimeric dUTPase (all-alpha-NTP-PPase superfamily)